MRSVTFSRYLPCDDHPAPVCPPSCERTYMKSTSESLSHPETSNGRAAGGNCVVARRGGEQPEADLRSQTKVNPIRFTTTASLRANGEACRMSGNRFLPHPSFTGEKRVVVDGWGENAGKVSCGSGADFASGQNPHGGNGHGRQSFRNSSVILYLWKVVLTGRLARERRVFLLSCLPDSTS